MEHHLEELKDKLTALTSGEIHTLSVALTDMVVLKPWIHVHPDGGQCGTRWQLCLGRIV